MQWVATNTGQSVGRKIFSFFQILFPCKCKDVYRIIWKILGGKYKNIEKKHNEMHNWHHNTHPGSRYETAFLKDDLNVILFLLISVKLMRKFSTQDGWKFCMRDRREEKCTP